MNAEDRIALDVIAATVSGFMAKHGSYEMCRADLDKVADIAVAMAVSVVSKLRQREREAR